MIRDHTPITIEEFNGLWARGGADSCPQDHFSDCDNIQFIQSGFKTRDGIDLYKPYANVLRLYTFIQETGSSLLVLNNSGQIFDTGSPTPFTPILTIPLMTDFGYVSIAGRAYITPSDGHTGLAGEYVYVYEGDGSSAKLAGGFAPTNADGALASANSATAGIVEAGIHIFGAVYETDTGFLTSIGPGTLPTVTAPGNKKVDLTNIPVSGSSHVTKVHIVATKAIDPTLYTGNTQGYQFFFVPGAIVTNGTTTLSVNFFDADLLEDASHLLDLFAKIPAGVGLGTYHGRLLVYGTHDDISLCYVSFVGEPEAVSQVDGLLIFPLDGNPITNAQEFRDILYVFKQTRTGAFNDNGDVPSSWSFTIIDEGIGSSLHGVGTVLDSGGVNIDYLIIIDYSGVMLFNGIYTRPELSWKIRDFWLNINRAAFDRLQIMNDSLSQVLYITMPNGKMLIGDYSNSLNPKDIRWSPWRFGVETSSITLIDKNKLIIGSLQGVA